MLVNYVSFLTLSVQKIKPIIIIIIIFIIIIIIIFIIIFSYSLKNHFSLFYIIINYYTIQFQAY